MISAQMKALMVGGSPRWMRTADGTWLLWSNLGNAWEVGTPPQLLRISADVVPLDGTTTEWVTRSDGSWKRTVVDDVPPSAPPDLPPISATPSVQTLGTEPPTTPSFGLNEDDPPVARPSRKRDRSSLGNGSVFVIALSSVFFGWLILAALIWVLEGVGNFLLWDWPEQTGIGAAEVIQEVARDALVAAAGVAVGVTMVRASIMTDRLGPMRTTLGVVTGAALCVLGIAVARLT